MPFFSKAHLAFDLLPGIYSTISTFEQTYRLIGLELVQVQGWSVCMSARMSILSPKSKAKWLSAKILIKIPTLSIDSTIFRRHVSDRCNSFDIVCVLSQANGQTYRLEFWRVGQVEGYI